MVRSIRFRWAGCGATLSGRMSQKAPKEKKTYFKILVRRLSVLGILLRSNFDRFASNLRHQSARLQAMQLLDVSVSKNTRREIGLSGYGDSYFSRVEASA